MTDADRVAFRSRSPGNKEKAECLFPGDCVHAFALAHPAGEARAIKIAGARLERVGIGHGIRPSSLSADDGFPEEDGGRPFEPQAACTGTARTKPFAARR